MNEIYKQELKELTEKMEKAELFAEKFPIFKDFIIKNKINNETRPCNFWERYKDLCLNWGIRRFYYEDNTNITNCKKKYKWNLFNIYFNTLSLYDSHEKYWLEELWKIDWVFFFDSSNSTFYIKDEWIEEFMEEANNWYNKALIEVKKDRREKEIKQLEEKLSKLKD